MTTTSAVAARPSIGSRRARAWLGTIGPALVIVVVQQLLFPSKGGDGSYLWGLVLQGVTLGMLTALVALSMALVYRANRIVNFAQGDLGLVPVALAVDLILFSGLNYYLAVATGLASAPEYPEDVIAAIRERTAKMSLCPLFWTPTIEGLLN